MAYRKRAVRKGGNRAAVSVISIIAAIVALMFGGKYLSEQAAPSTPVHLPKDGKTMTVQFIDVGQADSTLILLPDGEVMLIDAGGNASADALAGYLRETGIEKIDYLVGTHPHEDHIGGLDKVIDSFKIGKIYLPKVDDTQVPTTQTYEDVLSAIDDKGLTVTKGQGGVTVKRTDSLQISLIAPNSGKYAGLNSYSIAVKLSYGERSFLITGDAETDSEKEMLEKFDVKADVLKCGHHGSSTSTSAAFLKAVSPRYAVLSCGADNKYGHPHKETLQRLTKAGCEIYRTDEDKTITATCDGSEIFFETYGKSLAP